MTFKIKNWKLAVLALIFICFFTSLGWWQISRAQQKKVLLKSYAERMQLVPLTGAMLNHLTKWRFYRATLHGSYDNEHTILLDNKIFAGKVGYQVYTPFIAQDMAQPILVDRGFIPIGVGRQVLPKIKAITGPTTITGLINNPPTYVALGNIVDATPLKWPLRVEYINLAEIAQLITPNTHYHFYPSTISLTPHDPAAYDMQWQIVTMGPERHMGYAVQWFALALTLLILFVVLNRA